MRSNDSDDLLIDDQIHMIRERLQSPELISSISRATLDTGLLGLSLFYSYYALYTDDKTYRTNAENFLWDGLQRLDIYNFKPIHKVDSIDAQLSGIGRFIEFNNKNHFFLIESEEYFADLDPLMSELFTHQINRSDFDTSSGALAAGNYFLARDGQNTLANHHLSNCVKEAYHRAHRDRVQRDARPLGDVDPLEREAAFLRAAHVRPPRARRPARPGRRPASRTRSRSRRSS